MELTCYYCIEILREVGRERDFDTKAALWEDSFPDVILRLGIVCFSHLTEFTFPNFKYYLLSLTVLLRVSRLLVLGIVVHEGMDRATVEILDLEKVKLIYTNPGCCYNFCLKWAFKDKSSGITRVVYFSSTLNKLIDRCFSKKIMFNVHKIWFCISED